MQDGDEMPTVLCLIRKAIVLCFYDDIFQCARLDQLKEHAVKLPFLLDIADQHGHPAATLQSAKLFHHGVIHYAHEVLPFGDT